MPPTHFDDIILRCHTTQGGSESVGRMPYCGHAPGNSGGPPAARQCWESIHAV